MKIASGLVAIHSSVLTIQFALFYIFGIDLDPVHILSDVQQRGWGGMQEHSVLGGFRRLGGLYSEPGTYATFVAPLVAIIFLKNDDAKSVMIGVLGIISLFLTFSIYAWIFCVAILAVKFIKSVWSLIFFTPIVFGAFQLAMPYFQYRFITRSGNNGTEFRMEILESIFVFSTDSVSNFLFGSGLLSTKVPFEFVGALNDVGLIFYIFLVSGVVGIFILLTALFDACWRLRLCGMAVFTIMVSSKISIFAPMFWMLLIIMRHAGNEDSTPERH